METAPIETAPTQEDAGRREQALKLSFERFDAVATRMKEVYGLQLPRHLAVYAAFSASLTPLETSGLNDLERHPGGIMIWFKDGGLNRKTRDGLDPRLEMRYRRDPPEFVTVMGGDMDGLHYGLWYDDPAGLPSFIAHNYARDSAETWKSEVTVLRELTAHIRRRIEKPDYPEEPIPPGLHALSATLDWFREADEKSLAEDGPRQWANSKRGSIIGGLAPALPPDAGDSRATRRACEERSAAYHDKGQSEKIDSWISEAMEELKHGKPAFALTLGRELHWLDAEKYRATSVNLLCDAYKALGRHALAGIAAVHHAHRDLKSVCVY
jgi:hypothetical protein